MLQALRSNPKRAPVSSVHSIPAPTGGLNARDPLADMKPEDTIVMDNIFPEMNYATLRRGFESFATGMTGDVQALMTYHDLSGSEKLFAGANNKIWNATTAGVATSAYSTSITSNKWQWINFTNTAGTFLLCVNGSDTPLKYDGTTWATNSITGSISSSSNIINIWQHKERVWLVEKNTLNLWYLASQAITGTVTKLPLGGVFERGGQIVAGGTFSINDSGDGMDDVLVAVTDNGEAAVYMGTNPATDFLLVGRYDVGNPMGNRCLVKTSGDLVIITTSGAVSMRSLLREDRSKNDALAITAKIQELFNSNARNYKANFGWQGFIYPKARWAIFNIPIAQGVTQYQFVQNIITGAWCRFTNMNANCWGILNDDLYFGGASGVVYKADTGKQDNGSQIAWDLKSAFNDCGSPGQNKFFKGIRPLLLTTGTASILGGINVDYNNTVPSGTLSASSGSTGLWGSGHWGVAHWGGLGLLLRKWLTVGQIGTTVAARLRGAAKGISVQINGFDVLYEETKGQVF